MKAPFMKSTLWIAAAAGCAVAAGYAAAGDRPGSLDVTEITLSNGMTVLMAPRGEVPILSFEAMVLAGTMDEPAGKEGLSYFVGELLNRGTESYTAQELATFLDTMGAQLHVAPDYDYSTVSLSLLTKDAEVGLGLLREILSAAAFSPDDVERKRSEVLGQLQQLKDDYVDVVRKDFYDLIYGEHPYHRPLEGTETSVAGLSREDFLDFYSTFYAPNNVLLAVVGQFDPAAMGAQIRGAFEDWPARDVPARTPPPMPEPRREIKTTHRDVTQATLRLGHVGLPRDDPDYVTCRLMNFVLGGAGFGSRLMGNLREDLGITYGVYSNFYPRKEPGYFFTSTQVVNDSMNVAVREIFKEIDKIREEGITEDELEWAKRYYTGNLPLQLQSNGQLASLVLQQRFYGLPEEFWLKEIEGMQKVTLEEIREAARKHIHPESFALVVLGNFDEIQLEPR